MAQRRLLDVASVRDALTCVQVLVDASIEPPRRGSRRTCPIHNGNNPTSFEVRERRWRCYSQCGGGDVIDLSMRLHRLDFRSAVEHCARLAGLRPDRGSARAARIVWRRRESERANHESERLDRLEAWHATIAELDAARDDRFLAEMLMHDDREEAEPGTGRLLDSLGDPWLRAEVLLVRLDEIETGLRALQKEGAR